MRRTGDSRENEEFTFSPICVIELSQPSSVSKFELFPLLTNKHIRQPK